MCEGCGVPSSVCFCSALPPAPLPSDVQVLVLQHPQEQRRKNRTADTVLTRCVGSVKVVVGRTLPPLPPGTALLYPSPHAEPITPDLGLTSLVVLDGTWALCKELYQRNLPVLQGLRAVKIRPSLPSDCPYHGRTYGDYVLRKPPVLDQDTMFLSTAEAVALALDLAQPSPRPWHYSNLVRGVVRQITSTQLAMRKGEGVHRPEKRGYIAGLYEGRG